MNAHFPAPDYRPMILWGAGSQALVLNQMIEEQDGRVVALFCDSEDAPPFRAEVVAGNASIEAWVAENRDVTDFAVAIGGEHGKARLEKLEYLTGLGLNPVTLRHPTATVLSRKNLGRAVQLLAGSFVGVDAVIGDGVILNSGASVEHECRIGDGVHVAPRAALAGRVTVGARTLIGINATVCHDLTIAPDCIIGAGSVVTKDITEPGTYVGAPARRTQPD